jgi:hypothetical protein
MVKRHLEERRRKKTWMNIAKAVGKEARALSEIKVLKTRVKAIVKERKVNVRGKAER